MNTSYSRIRTRKEREAAEAPSGELLFAAEKIGELDFRQVAAR